MPELGPYGSMREEARKSLPYRDLDTFRRANKIRGLNVSGLRSQIIDHEKALGSP